MQKKKNHQIKRLSAVLICILVASELGFAVNPLEPVNTSSPRDTLESFIENIVIVRRIYDNGGNRDAYMNPIERLTECMDLSKVPPAERGSTAGASAMMLADILGKVAIPDSGTVPGEDEVDETLLAFWSIPGTDLELQRIESDDQPVSYRFSARTLERLPDIYERAAGLPYLPHAWVDAYQLYLNVPGSWIQASFIDNLPHWLTVNTLGNPRWKVLSLTVLVLFVLGVLVAVYLLLRKFNIDPEKHPGRSQGANLAFAVVAMLMMTLARRVAEGFIGLRVDLLEVFLRVCLIVIFTMLIVAIVSAFNLGFTILKQTSVLKRRGMNEHLVKMIFQITAALASIIIAVLSIEYLGLELIPLMAGLGIGGFAIALAARPTVENIIGGLILFADKPVRVGDLCRYGQEEGFIEEIGLRSTRIRKLDDTLVSVPNAHFSLLELENRSRRRRFLYRTILQFRYETTRDQLRYVLIRIREMILAHPKTVHERMRVRFLEFGAYSLDVELYVNLRATDWNDFLAVREDVNFRIMEIVEEAGVSFAFPSTTAYMAQDRPADDERVSAAEERTRSWISDDELPYPYHSRETVRELKSSLDYPPEGSPEFAKKRDGDD